MRTPRTPVIGDPRAPLAFLPLVLILFNEASGSVSVVLSTPERAPCRGPAGAGGPGAGGRVAVAGCSLHCLWSERLCRLCCQASGHGDDPWPMRTTTEEPMTDEPDSEAPTEKTEEPGEPGEPGGELQFPDALPAGSEDAMLETAAHILAIVCREDPQRVRIWLENPARNLDNLEVLAARLASMPRAPYGRAYWRLVLRSAKDRPFTLLKEALAVRAVHLANMGGGGDATEATTDAKEEPTEAPSEMASEAGSEGVTENWWSQRRPGPRPGPRPGSRPG